ncbi:hypothetical protein KY284_020325 [Solanum tuberosum]|nr:hypothetical protein KY284_020325 [Solanum tuberosum]
MAHMRTQIDLLTKNIIPKPEKVNVVGQPYRNDHNGVYVPPVNRDRARGSSCESKLEDMLAKVLEQDGREKDEAEQVDDLDDAQPIPKLA